MTQKEFIERAISAHNNKYDYSKVDFKNTATKVHQYFQEKVVQNF